MYANSQNNHIIFRFALFSLFIYHQNTMNKSNSQTQEQESKNKPLFADLLDAFMSTIKDGMSINNPDKLFERDKSLGRSFDLQVLPTQPPENQYATTKDAQTKNQ